MRIPSFLLTLAFSSCPGALTAQALAGPPEPSAPSSAVRVTRFARPPVLDGILDESEWATAARLEGFVQTQPGDNTAPGRQTIVYLGFDARALYLAIRAYDDSAQVRATVAARDRIDADDNASIILDTFGDRRRAYVFAFNPLGIQQDGVYTEGVTDTDYSVDLVLESRGRVDGEGWVVEAAIPLSSLRYAVAPGQRWIVQVQRRIKHLNNEQDSWRPLERGNAGFLTQAGAVEGFDQLPRRRAVELIPSVTGLGEGARTPANGFDDGAVRADVGLSAKVGLAADVTAELALNPDYAQVEADAPVVTANQRFPILFAEKRPFFLEGVELFRTPLLVVHTRAIVDPAAAVKLTGKRGTTSFGVLGAHLGGHGNLVGITRLRRNLGAASHVGLLTTAYRFGERENLTGGTDFRLAVGTRFVATVQLTGTWARRTFYDPDSNRASLRVGRGLGYSAVLRATGRHLSLTLSGQGRSPDYVADAGFTPQANTNAWTFATRWDAEPRESATLISWSASHAAHLRFDWDGRPTYAYLWPQVTLNFPRQTSVTAGPYVDYVRLFEEEFGPRRNAGQAGAFAGAGVRETVYRGFAVSAETTPDRRWNLSGFLGWEWDQFDFDFGGGPRFPRVSPAALADPNAPLDPGQGSTGSASLSLTWLPAPPLRISGSYLKSRLRRNDTGRLAYDENLWSAQAAFQASRFASIRVRADYRSSYRNFQPQVLVAWTPNPGTSLYAGYNDDLNHDGYSPVTGAHEGGWKRNRRTLFVKASYLLQWMLPVSRSSTEQRSLR